MIPKPKHVHHLVPFVRLGAYPGPGIQESGPEGAPNLKDHDMPLRVEQLLRMPRYLWNGSYGKSTSPTQASRSVLKISFK